MSEEKCFCHLNGYAVKDSIARAEIARIDRELVEMDNTVQDLDQRFFDLENKEGSTVTVPTKTSELVNDSGFITGANIPAVPTKTSELVNDSGFITGANIPAVPTKTSQLENDGDGETNFVTKKDLAFGFATGGPITSNGYDIKATYVSYETGNNYGTAINGSGVKRIEPDGTENTFTFPKESGELALTSDIPEGFKMPMDEWDVYGSLGEIKLTEGGIYYVQGVPGVGCLVKVESNFDCSNHRTPWFTREDGFMYHIYSTLVDGVYTLCAAGLGTYLEKDTTTGEYSLSKRYSDCNFAVGVKKLS